MIQRHLELEVTTRLLLRDMNLSNPLVNVCIFYTIRNYFFPVSVSKKSCTGGHGHWVSLLKSFTK